MEDIFSNPFGKKVKNASKKKQIAWNKKTPKSKRKARKKHSDIDLDGVPDIFDCKPHNPFEQGRFHKDDMKIINNLKSFTPGEVLGRGNFGEVHQLKEHPDFVIKTSNPTEKSWGKIEDEARKSQNDFLDTELTIPSKEVEIMKGGFKQKAILRPKVKVMTEATRPEEYKEVGDLLKVVDNNLSDEQISQIRKGMEELNDKEITTGDFLQVGIDKRGKPYLFDLGECLNLSESKYSRPGLAREQNSYYWDHFIKRVGKQNKTVKLGIEKDLPEIMQEVKQWKNGELEDDSLEVIILKERKAELRQYYISTRKPVPDLMKWFFNKVKN